MNKLICDLYLPKLPQVRLCVESIIILNFCRKKLFLEKALPIFYKLYEENPNTRFLSLLVSRRNKLSASV